MISVVECVYGMEEEKGILYMLFSVVAELSFLMGEVLKWV